MDRKRKYIEHYMSCILCLGQSMHYIRAFFNLFKVIIVDYKDSIKLCGIYIFTLFIIMYSNISQYYYELNDWHQKNQKIIKYVESSILKPIIDDLNIIINLLIENHVDQIKKLLKYKINNKIKYHLINTNKYNQYTLLVSEKFQYRSIIISNAYNQLIIKTEEIENALQELLPNYIEGRILDQYEITAENKYIYPLVSDNLYVNFVIDDNYFKSIKESLYQKALYKILSISALCFIIYMYTYNILKKGVYKSITSDLSEVIYEKNKLEDKCLSLTNENLGYKSLINVERKINESIIKKVMFCKVFTNKLGEDNRIKDAIIKQFYFFNTNHPTKLCKTDLVRDINSYFHNLLHETNTTLFIKSDEEYLQLPCDIEYFYQVLFSLLNNRMYGCRLKNKHIMNLYFAHYQNDIEITCTDNGMNLDIYKMDNHSCAENNMLLYILPWFLVENSLKKHCHNFNFTRDKDTNKSIIRLKSNISDKTNKDKKICYIKDYLK